MVWLFFSLNWDISGLRRCMQRLYKIPKFNCNELEFKTRKKFRNCTAIFFIELHCIRVET